MTALRHLVPALRLFHGADAFEPLERELERVGSRRAVIVCGASIVREARGLALVRDAMGSRCAGVIGNVQAHSPLPAVQAVAHELQRLQADAVVAVGGGSAIVTARGASILLAEGGDAHALCTQRDARGQLRSPKLMAPKLPQLSVPTTPTTATLKVGSALLDPDNGARLALFDPKTRAQAVFVHPALLRTPPRALVVSSSLNTMAMALEGLMSRTGDPFSDGLLVHALRLLARGMRGADDDASRNDLMFASLLCGHGTDYTGGGIAIPLGHAVSARFHIDNGLANAVVMPHVIRFNAEAAAAGIPNIATALDCRPGEDAPEQVIAAVERLCDSLGAPRRLRDLHVSRESLAELAAISMEDWFVRDNPRPVRDAAELQQVLENAW